MKKIKRWVENCFINNPVPEFKPFLLKKYTENLKTLFFYLFLKWFIITGVSKP